MELLYKTYSQMNYCLIVSGIRGRDWIPLTRTAIPSEAWAVLPLPQGARKIGDCLLVA